MESTTYLFARLKTRSKLNLERLLASSPLFGLSATIGSAIREECTLKNGKKRAPIDGHKRGLSKKYKSSRKP